MKKLIKNLLRPMVRIFRPAAPKVARFVPTERTFLGKTVYIHDILSYNMCVNELFVSESYNFKARTDAPYIIDCGANLGMSVIYFKKLYPKASILAFEADDHVFKFLEKNVKSFGYDNVELVNKAVWNGNGELTFLAEGGAGGRLEASETGDHVYKKVPSVRLRDYLTGKKVDFLKMDIEGAEYDVLKDCADALSDIDFMFIEYHSMIDREQNLQEILEIIKNAGFRYHIKEAYTTKYPLIERELNFGMDLQLNIFCYKN